jgi:hypothetical protein
MDLFGKRAAVAAIILADNSKEAELLTTKYEGAAGAAKRMADIMRDNLIGDADKARSALEGLAINLGEKLNPFLRRSTQNFTSFIGKLNELVKIDPAQTIRNEQQAVLGLVSQLTDANNSEQDRFDVLSELKRLNPDIVEGLDAENLSISKLRENVDLYNKSIVNRIILANLNKEEEEKAIEVADVSKKRGLALIELNKEIARQDQDVAFSKASLAEKVDLIISKTKEELEALESTFTSQEKNLQIQTFRTEQAKRLRSEIANLEVWVNLLNKLTEEENQLSEESANLISRQSELMKVLGIDTDNQTEAINNQTTAIKERGSAELEAAETRAGIHEVQQENTELEIISQNRLQEIRDENLEKERERATEISNILEEERNQRLANLAAITTIFGRQSIISKAAVAFEAAQALRLRAISLGVITTKSAETQAKAAAAFPPPFNIPFILQAIAQFVPILALFNKSKKFKTGTKGKYSTPSDFVTSEDGKPEAIITKSGKGVITTEPTLFSGAANSRVFSNPELTSMVNNVNVNPDQRLIKELLAETKKGSKRVETAIEKIPRSYKPKEYGVQMGRYRRTSV